MAGAGEHQRWADQDTMTPNPNYDDAKAVTEYVWRWHWQQATRAERTLASAIEDQIDPDYLWRQRRSEFRNALTIISTSAAIVATALPRELGRLASLLLLVGVGAPVLVGLVRYSIPRGSGDRRRILKSLLRRAILWVGGATVLSGLAVIVEAQVAYGGWWRSPFDPLITLVAIVVGLLFIGIWWLIKPGRLRRFRRAKTA